MHHNGNMTASLISGSDGVEVYSNRHVPSIMELGSPFDPDEDFFCHHRRLVEWATALDGYFHPDVRIAHDKSKGFHIVVAQGRQIRAETRIVSCPMSATLSILNALNVEPFCSHGTKFPKAFLENNIALPEMIQTFFLMEQYVQGEDSWWAPYINTLPSPQDVQGMQLDGEEDDAWLDGTNLKAGFHSQISKWQDLFSRGMRSLKFLSWANASNGKYTWELYRWAATIFGSRSFTSSVLDDTLPADQVRMSGKYGIKSPTVTKNLFVDKFAVLLPLLDILNHWPVTPVEWQARSSFVGMQVLETYESGRELYNNYGPKDNEGLLLSYGFVIPDNRFDHVVIAIRAPPGSSLATARTWPKDERSHPEFKSFLLHVDHPTAREASCLEVLPFSYDLLDSISVLSGNDRELQTMFLQNKTLMSTSLGKNKRFEDHRNLLASLSQLLRDCRVGAERLRRTYPKNPKPQSSKQRSVQIYRDSQYALYETACLICEYVLLRTGTEWVEHRLRETLKPRFEAQHFAKWETAVQGHNCVTMPGELLSSRQFLEMIPLDTAAKWQAALNELEGSLTSNASGNEISHTELGSVKTRLAFLLSASYCEYDRGIKLPSRLKGWLQQLTQWYPPSDENWSYVPHEGPWAPGEEPPSALMSLLKARASMSPHISSDSIVKLWLKSEMLCWGWNVMEEEGVIVPADLISLMDSEATLSGEVGFLLYCKHY